ncbi:uncharacterized protein BJ171DRAFT_445895 [Polychytrium aggregatum]|uniref:uncharacterized protein n=1 Tax=Polychytrium aggregatum TaxID=110093 RepID=UPI0022FEA118|nr:uncharacterized protein BJ171DRAFT_445895 [Polychytrium aggregatum]KAI9197515.1 hypothetical protein BJ171DRAFT_445895 [Polychytrium aggregatum]
MSSRDKLAEFLPAKPERLLISSILFPELQKELEAHPELIGSLKGLFIVTVLKKGIKKEEWYILFQGQEAVPVVTQTRPVLPASGKGKSKTTLPIVLVEIEDADILNFITGGLTGVKAFVSQRIKILGDLVVAQQIEDVFVKTHGVEKAMRFLERTGIHVNSESKAKL